ncbi:MAG: TolC family protein [Roseateles sp.]|uniref:TolC family protein n=1 Tax=Roseateles sp. TaxID=1971397 RepID=UPI00403548CB
MRTRHWAWPGVLAATALLWASPGLAQAPSPIKLGFDAAWARKPEQRAAPLRQEAAAAAAAAASRWTPEPPALEMGARTDRITRNDGAREYDATVAVPLWLPGERPRARAAAAAGAALLDQQLLAWQWRLAGEVRDAYWAYQRTRIDQQLAQQRLAGAQQMAADVSRRVQAGDLARADGHAADAAAAAAESALAEAGVAMTDAAQAWNALTGLPLVGGDDGGVAERLPDGDPPRHPALAELSAKAELARRQRDLAVVQSRPNPELTVGAARERGGLGERHRQSVLVGVRIPLGQSGASESRIATAGADLLEAQSQLEIEEQRVRSQAHAARARVTALENAHAAAERRADLARESRRFFDKAFRLGETDLPTRLRIEFDAVEAERQAARSRVERDAAVSHLRQAVGQLPE